MKPLDHLDYSTLFLMAEFWLLVLVCLWACGYLLQFQGHLRLIGIAGMIFTLSLCCPAFFLSLRSLKRIFPGFF